MCCGSWAMLLRYPLQDWRIVEPRLGDCSSQIIFNCQSFGNCPPLKKAFLFKIIFSYQAQPEPSNWLIQGFKSQLNSEYPCQSLKEVRQSPSSPSANTWSVLFPSGVNYNSTAHWTSYRRKISLMSASWVTWPGTVLSSKADGLNHLLASPQRVSKFLVVDGTWKASVSVKLLKTLFSELVDVHLLAGIIYIADVWEIWEIQYL